MDNYLYLITHGVPPPIDEKMKGAIETIEIERQEPKATIMPSPQDKKDDVIQQIHNIIESIHDLPITGYGETYASYLTESVDALNEAISVMIPQEDFEE